MSDRAQFMFMHDEHAQSPSCEHERGAVQGVGFRVQSWGVAFPVSAAIVVLISHARTYTINPKPRG